MNNSVKTSIRDVLKGITIMVVGANGVLRSLVDELGYKLGIVSDRTICRHLVTTVMHMYDIVDSTEWAELYPKDITEIKEDLRSMLREYV